MALRFLISVNGKYGYIDENGAVVVAPKFDSAGRFSEDRAAFVEENGHGFLDPDGNVAILPLFAYAHEFSEGLCGVAVAAGRGRPRWGFINTAGEWVVEPQYEAVDRYSDGRAVVTVDGKLWRCLGLTGEVLFETEAGRLHRFQEERVPFQPRGKSMMGYLDAAGEVVIEPRYHAASPFAEGLGLVLGPKRKSGFIDRDGTEVISPTYASATSFSEGLTAVSTTGDHFGFVDRQGQEIVAQQFAAAHPFTEGLACVAFVNARGEMGDFGYVDSAGQTAIPPQFSAAQPFRDGLAAVRIRQGPRAYDLYIDRRGDPVWMSDG